MNKEDIQLLFEYDRWANNRVFSSLAALTREQFLRNLNGSFPSIRDTALHILAGEWNWLRYWKAPSQDAGVLADLRRQREIIFRPEAFPDLAFVWRKWLEIEREQIEFAASITDESLQRIYPARDAQLRLGHLMQHVANHSTYHRGQISLMMRQVASEPVETDFHVFLGEREAGAGPARETER